jgi:hypothetical protein
MRTISMKTQPVRRTDRPTRGSGYFGAWFRYNWKV